MINDREIACIEQIIEICSDVEKDLSKVKNKEDFYDNYDAQRLLAFDIEQIGEMVKRISNETKTIFKDVPWEKIKSMRNRITHDYGIIDVKIVWNTAKHDIPKLKAQCESILKNNAV